MFVVMSQVQFLLGVAHVTPSKIIISPAEGAEPPSQLRPVEAKLSAPEPTHLRVAIRATRFRLYHSMIHFVRRGHSKTRIRLSCRSTIRFAQSDLATRMHSNLMKTKSLIVKNLNSKRTGYWNSMKTHCGTT